MANRPAGEADTRYCALARQTLARQLAALLSEAKGAQSNEDIENVHRMRVASRRMRAALRVFQACCPRKRFRRWDKEMKRITTALGNARDADVQIIYLEGVRTRARPEGRAGVSRLLKDKQDRRESLQPALVDAIDDFLDGVVTEEMERTISEGRPDRQGTWKRSRALAYLHILGRTAELRSFADLVHDESQKEMHHRMRIAAKRLRYTLEIFSVLYKGHLSEELSQVKQLQRVLGEMHDCDVWIQDLQARLMSLERADEALRAGFGMVLEDRERERAARYRQFVDLWDGMEATGLLARMLERTGKEAAKGLRPEEALGSELELHPSTPVAVVSDVHANLHALRAVLEDAKARGASLIVNLGDTVGYGPCPEETVHLLRERGAVSVAGNFDLKVLRSGGKRRAKQRGEKWFVLDWTYRQLSEESRAYLASLPRVIELEVAGMDVVATHGSPDSMDEYVGQETPKRRLKQIAASTGADLVITGHTHHPSDRNVAETRFVNAGSVGRQDDGDPRATYALLKLSPLAVEHHRVEYDVQAATEAMRIRGLPSIFGRMLSEGHAPSELERPAEPLNPNADAPAACWALNRVLGGGDEHSRHVADLALRLFDDLKDLHRLGPDKRVLLECAAACHDIGWLEGRRGHNKASMRMVLEEDALPLGDKERMIVALVARYHRKAMPRADHPHFCGLKRKERLLVCQLASLLRVADGLDNSHRDVVTSVRAEHNADSIILHITHTSDPDMEERDARKKGDMMREVFRRDLLLVREGS